MNNESASTRQMALLIAWFIAAIAVVATLYAGEVKHLPICHLCWYQRICIYPLFLLLGIAAYKDDYRVVVYALPLTIVGFIIALYQYLTQMVPAFEPIQVCSNGPACNAIHLKLWGFITFPFLSMVATFVIFILLIIARSCRRY